MSGHLSLRTGGTLVAALFLVICAWRSVSAADVILNEYNAVRSDRWLACDEGPPLCDADDTFFGRIQGNGGNWFELVVTTDHVDMRGWQLAWRQDGVGGEELGVLTLSNDSLWADIRNGTLITVTEWTSAETGLDTDAGYDPSGGDWWINVNSFDGQYLTTTTNVGGDGPGNFSVGNDNWQLTIRDSASAIVFGPAGEGIPASAPGIGSREVLKLEEDPSPSIDPVTSAYNDGTSSSFGSPNIWSGGTMQQDFSALRVLGCTGPGDCDDTDLCTTDTCEATECVFTPVDCGLQICDPGNGSCVDCLADADCADGDLCNGTESCDQSVCTAGTNLDCDDGVACTTDSCSPAQGCVNLDACPLGDACNPQTGQCEAGLTTIALVASAEAGSVNTSATLPVSTTRFGVGDTIHLDVWARATDSGGFAQVSTDVRFDPALVSVVSVTQTPLFSLFPNAVIDNVTGLVDDLSGSVSPVDPPCDTHIGAFEWARVAEVELRVDAAGDMMIAPDVTDSAIFVVAFCGVFDSPAVDYVGVDVQLVHTVTIELVSRSTPSSLDELPVLPASQTQFGVGETVFMEMWAQTTDPNGLAQVSADVSFDPALVNAANVTQSPLFNLFPNGTIDNATGLVDDLSGSVAPVDPPCDTHVGSVDWARVAGVELLVEASGNLTVDPDTTGSTFFVVAHCGGFDAPLVDYIGRDIQLLGTQSPRAESPGPRYIAVRPQPPDSLVPIKLLVESPELACLSKFAGVLACGGTGDTCKTDADCNACTGSLRPCLTNTDCKTCSDQPTFPCSTDGDCNTGMSCVEIQTCQVSGQSCISAPLPLPIDIDGDGVIDGAVATLVDNPANAMTLTPAEWVGGASNHCNRSLVACSSESDCDSGNCLLSDGRPSATPCSVLAQDCAGGEVCQLTETCLKAAVYLHGEDIIPSELIDEIFVPQTYDVSAVFGGGSPTTAANVEMKAWGDTAGNNHLVNVTDVAFVILAIKQQYDAARDITRVGTDMVKAIGPCFTDPSVIGAADLQRVIRAFLRFTYEEEVLASASVTGCQMPCP